MPSTNKTDILKLNQYLGTDRPSYLDYNKDMEKIDELAKNHNSNTDRIDALEEGSIKNPHHVPNGTDFNTLTEPGWYYNEANVTCSEMGNAPIKLGFSMQIISLYGEDTVIQIFYCYTGAIYQRIRAAWRDPKWGSWTSLQTPQLLWSGDWRSGSIRVPDSNIYNTFIVKMAGANCISTFSESNYAYVNSYAMAERNEAQNIFNAIIFRSDENWSYNQMPLALSHYIFKDHGSTWGSFGISKIFGVL